MTDDNQRYELSRRKVLAGLGTVGAASAAAGLGTSALFSDTESFEDNTLTAGSLDLKVDWEEHYSYPQVYDRPDPTVELDVTRTEPDDTSSYTALPDPQNPMVWVHNEDLDAYMDNTAIEAYPDPDDDGIQESFNMGDVGSFCEDGADTPSDLDPVESFRTANDDTMENEERTPLVNLNDVKPGDFGELTLSFHLCDNDGYVWMQGDLVGADENGLTEPEADADGEDGPDGDTVELLDEVQTALWYDGDCDNVFDTGGGGQTEGEKADVVIVLDRSGSMGGNPLTQATNGANTLIDALGPNDQVSVVSFADNVSLDQGLTTDHNAAQTAVNNISSGGGTNMEAGVEQAHEELFAGDDFSAFGESGNARANARKIVVFLSDGEANEGTSTDPDNDPTQEASTLKTAGAEIFTISYAGGPQATLEAMATDPNDGPENEYAFEADVSTIEDTFESIGGTVSTGGEEAIFRGTLREALDMLTTGEGVPLDGDLSTEERACYPALQTSCVGFSWWVPTDVGNEIQTDSVQFDVGFYAEQCRNNDPESTTTTSEPTNQTAD
jgi:Ca-activated chloride channel family protein